MSISCAPTRTASSVSAILTEVKLCPDGNAVATEAIRTVLPRRCSTQSAMRSGYTHTAASFLGAECGPNQAGVPASPSPVVSPATSSSPAAVPPAQRMEASLPAPVEETGAASAGGKLYVIGGFNAAGASLDSVYVFDGSTWAAGPRLPLPVDHPSAATMEDRVYLAGGHTNGRDSAHLFRLDSDHWTELAAMHYARGGHALVAAADRKSVV